MSLIEKIMLGIQVFSGCSLDRYHRLLAATKKYPEFFDIIKTDHNALVILINTILANGDITIDDIVYLQSKGVV